MKLINVSHFNVEIKSETGDYLILMPDKIFTISALEKEGETNQIGPTIYLEENTLILRDKEDK